MIKTNTKKICIVVSSLGAGGAERSSALLSEMLFDLNFDVHIVSVLDKIDYPYKGKLLNLGKLKAEDDSKIGRLKRLKVFKNYLKTHGFDYVIDNRTRIGFFKELIISKFIYKSYKTIYTVHSYNTDLYFNPNKTLRQILYGSTQNIVTVSNAITTKLKTEFGFSNVTTIYNANALENENLQIEKTNIEPFVLFFGRLDDDVKNISLLLNSYEKSNLPSKNVKLKILGDGKDLNKLKHKVKDLKLSDSVVFLPHNPKPSVIVKSALFTLLTSRYEGFPMVLLESLAVGTPVVSVDCKSGPNEIIVHENNGLLVENYNADELAKAMNRLLEDKDLYLHCKSNAKVSIQKFSKATIAKQWKSLLS